MKVAERDSVESPPQTRCRVGDHAPADPEAAGVSSKRKRGQKGQKPAPAPTPSPTKRYFFLVAAAALLLAGLYALNRPSDSRDEPWNLVLISIDTLRADHLSSYGSSDVSTPHIDRLAEEGVLFEQVQT